MALVTATNRMYVFNGAGWYSIALINTNPVITTGGNATYDLAIDGTPTVITLIANDPEDVPITWSYAITSGALEDTTVTAIANEFTITPGAIDATFDLTFTASDGINLATSVSSFTLQLSVNWSAATLVRTIQNPSPYGTAADDAFGNSVAMDEEFVIVGANSEDDGATSSGIAYIFNAVTGSLIHTLRNPESNKSSNYYGESVSISGNNAIVGAVYTDNSSGKAYIYNVTTGALVHNLTNPNAYNTPATDNFGKSVSISGNYAIVGAPFEDDSGGNQSGKAYIFNVTTGALLFTLNNPNAYSTSAADNFGYSVAVSGNYAIVGADYEDSLSGTNIGKAYIFNVTTGALVYTLDNPSGATNSRFGYSVAISSDYAAVGAPYHSAGSGKVYVFNVNTGALLQTFDNRNLSGTGGNDNFGFSVALGGDIVLVGAPGEDTNGTSAGVIYMYDITTASLILPGVFYNSAPSQANMGYSVSISGRYAIAGTPYDNNYAGTVKVFTAG